MPNLSTSKIWKAPCGLLLVCALGLSACGGGGASTKSGINVADVTLTLTGLKAGNALKLSDSGDKIVVVTTAGADTAQKSSDSGDTLAVVTTNGARTFKMPVGRAYRLGIAAQSVGQYCGFVTAKGAQDTLRGVVQTATPSVKVTCVDDQPLPVKVSGLSAVGLGLSDGKSALTIGRDGDYAFPLRRVGTSYTLSIVSQPIKQQCEFIGTGSATRATGEVGVSMPAVKVVCVDLRSLPVKVSGLSAAGLSLSDKTDNLKIERDGDYAFPLRKVGTAYDLSIASLPPKHRCVFVGTDSVTRVAGAISVLMPPITMTCTQLEGLQVAVQGLVRTGLVVADNLGNEMPMNVDEYYTFPNQAVGAEYTLTIRAVPSGQRCGFVNSSAQLQSSTAGRLSTNMAAIILTCQQTLAISASVASLNAGGRMVLKHTTTEQRLTFTANGSQSFNDQLVGDAFGVTIETQPARQFCALNSSDLIPVIGKSDTVQLGMAAIAVTCDNLVDLTQLYGRLLLNWTQDGALQSHFAVFNQSKLSNDSYGLVLNGFLGSNTAWAISCSALDATAAVYNPSYYLCMLVNQNQDVYLQAFQLTGLQMTNGRFTYCVALISASACVNQLRNAPLNSLNGSVQAASAAALRNAPLNSLNDGVRGVSSEVTKSSQASGLTPSFEFNADQGARIDALRQILQKK